MYVDPDQVAADVEDAIEMAGTPVFLPLGLSLTAVKVSNEREMARLLKIEGAALDKVASVFLFDGTASGKVSKGDRILNIDDAFIAEVIHTEQLAGVTVYVAVGAFAAV